MKEAVSKTNKRTYSSSSNQSKKGVYSPYTKVATEQKLVQYAYKYSKKKKWKAKKVEIRFIHATIDFLGYIIILL